MIRTLLASAATGSVFMILFSCTPAKERQADIPARDTLQYEMKTFRLESQDGCASDTNTCASYEVIYPVFAGLPEQAMDSIRKKINETVATGNPEQEEVSFEAAGHAFISDFENAMKEFPEYSGGWYYNASISVEMSADTLISMSVVSEYFTGGAHGGYGTYFINVDPVSGKTINLKDVLKPGYEEPLRKVGEEVFRKTLEMSDTTSLAGEGFEFADDKFVLNDNYGFTSDGIWFVYNIYEIAPYVLGAQQVLIPYEKIKDWLQ